MKMQHYLFFGKWMVCEAWMPGYPYCILLLYVASTPEGFLDTSKSLSQRKFSPLEAGIRINAAHVRKEQHGGNNAVIQPSSKNSSCYEYLYTSIFRTEYKENKNKS